MSEARGPRTATYLKRFNVWFGGIFLGIGLVALVIGAVVFVVMRGDRELGDGIWALLGAPLAVGSIFSIVGGAFMTAGLRRARREERVLQVGTTTDATVTAVERTNTRVNHRYLWRVRYTYIDLRGQPQDGDSGYLSAEEAHSYAIGEQVFVRYDPERPAESVWLGRDELPG